MPGWRLSKADGSDERTDLSFPQVRELLAQGAYGPDDLVASPKQKVMLAIGSVAALEKFLPKAPDSADRAPGERASGTSLPEESPAEARRIVEDKEVPERLTRTKVEQAAVGTKVWALQPQAGAGAQRRPLAAVEEDTEIDISAMIDVVFQLLIFFMVCSVLQPGSAVNVPQTETGRGLDSEHCMVIGISRAGPEEPVPEDVAYFLERQPEMKLSLEEVARRAADGAEQESSQAIILRAAKDVPYQAVRDLLVELRKHTEVSVRTGVKEKG